MRGILVCLACAVTLVVAAADHQGVPPPPADNIHGFDRKDPAPPTVDVAPQTAYHDGDPHHLTGKAKQLLEDVLAMEKSVVYHENDGEYDLTKRREELRGLDGARIHIDDTYWRVCENQVLKEAQELDRKTHELRREVELTQHLAAEPGRGGDATQHERAAEMHLRDLHEAEQQWARVAYARHICQSVETQLASTHERYRALVEDAEAQSLKDM